MNHPEYVARVLVEVPLPPGEGLFSYRSDEPFQRGERITVPLGKTDRPVEGVVLELGGEELTSQPIKPILARSGELALDEIHTTWLLWIWSHFLVGGRALLGASLYPRPKWVRLLMKTAMEGSWPAEIAKRPGYQALFQWLIDEGGEGPRSGCPQPGLLSRAARRGWIRVEEKEALPGQKGEGGEDRELVWAPWRVQRERLLERLQTIRSEGRQSLVLIPELSLADSLVELIAHQGIEATPYLGEHTLRQREGAARMAQEEGPRTWIGHQQALFLPFRRLGGVFVLQEESPGYRGRPPLDFPIVPAANRLAQLAGACLSLFSRSPSMESYLETYRGLGLRYQAPPSRARRRIIVRQGSKGTAPALLEGIRRASQAGKRSLIYLNRRGYANALLCADCGETFPCPTCSVALTPHRDRLLCHYCGFQMPIPTICPNCRGVSLEAWGVGTERMEEELRKETDRLPLFRLDAETTSRRQERLELVKRFRETPGAVLLTTGLVRGFPLPRVALVAVLNADYALCRPSFHSTERAYQLIANLEPLADEDFFLQVSSRHGVERLLQAGPAFYREELESRKEADFPPHLRLLRFLFTGPEEDPVWQAAREFRQRLEEASLPFHLDGPLMDIYPHLRGQWRVEILARSTPEPLPEALRPILAFQAPRGGIQLTTTLDPEE